MTSRLDRLLEGIATAPPLALQGLALDSRKVVPGGVFVALPGRTAHGLEFAAEAQRRGAAAILFEPPVPGDIDLPAVALPVPTLREHLGEIADRYFGSPSSALRMVGVTGTNGKTSIVQLLVQALSQAGSCAGSIGTLGVGLNGALSEGERTTPDVIAVHAALAALRSEGAEDVAMEVSSHALDQGRVDAVRFRVAVFTNLTRDHLDYHGDMASYGAAKARLFGWPGLKAAVVNLDDAFGADLMARLPPGVDAIGVSSRGAGTARLRAEDIALSAAGLAFELVDGPVRERVQSRLLGRFNIDNLLAVAGVLLAFGWPLKRICTALAVLEPVPGRMTRLGGEAGRPLLVVDYAHTPDALEQALSSLRAHTAGRLICVFGCGGERDAGKRPQMGSIAERLADMVIVTDDNPRGEDGHAIVSDICRGFARPDAVIVMRDRADAIAQAIRLAGAEDTVLIAGKGHESYQESRGVRYPFDDQAIAARVLGGQA
ncbi:UDP-N-acetylmuramoyl-L-alanyl-D-glutamate--2,6-diaminopimelate ligase [Xanthomonadaceae bacterium JHOS43]|nr:UDP-N-acetylmuramoyl-L-alanyl-D-glutamate--2,6-diaminopimelate ligase [Xanthomonadaceae bacterium JHOS43]